MLIHMIFLHSLRHFFQSVCQTENVPREISVPRDISSNTLVVSILHPVIMVQIFALIMQLIERANLLRVTAFCPRRNLDNVTEYIFSKFIP